MAEVISVFFQVLVALSGIAAMGCMAMTALPKRFPRIWRDMDSYNFTTSMIVIGMAAIGWSLCYYSGIHMVLWFIPEGWGWDNGSGLDVRTSLSATLSIMLTAVSMYELKIIADGYLKQLPTTMNIVRGAETREL